MFFRKLISLDDIDILEVNYSKTYFQDSGEEFSLSIVLEGFYSIIVYSVKQIVKDIISTLRNEKIKNKAVFFCISVNQFNSLRPLSEGMDQSVFMGLSHRNHTRIPMGIGCLISLFLSPYFIYVLNTKYKNKRTKILKNLDAYFFIYGMYVWWIFYLKIYRPKVIIVSNDHLVWHRILRMAAQRNSIPVVYVQHASVTEQFPKLDFDFSLLEGKDAYNKYLKKSIEGEVKLIGMMKFDKYYKFINEKNTVDTIGISTNLLDDEKAIIEFVSKLSKSLTSKNIILRPHPRDDRRELYDKLEQGIRIELSDPRKENSFDFLKSIDVNIARESSIHLEAVLLNVYPIYFQLSKGIKDHYGYIENDLVTDIFSNSKSLRNKLLELETYRPFIRDRAKYYVSTVNTEYDGRSTDKASFVVDKFLTDYYSENI